MPTQAVLATWPFGQIAVRVALPLLQKGNPALDAAIAGLRPWRTIPKSTRSATAVWPMPSAPSVSMPVSWTAVHWPVEPLPGWKMCVIQRRWPGRDGTHSAHFVGGRSARLFAVQQGFPLDTLLTAESVAQWEKTRPKRNGAPKPDPGPAPARNPGSRSATIR